MKNRYFEEQIHWVPLNVDDANLGQRAKAKNVARLDRSWYTIQAADLPHFIIYDCHDICSLAEEGEVLQVICGYQKAAIKRAVGRKEKSLYVTPNNALVAPC